MSRGSRGGGRAFEKGALRHLPRVIETIVPGGWASHCLEKARANSLVPERRTTGIRRVLTKGWPNDGWYASCKARLEPKESI